MTSCLPPNEAFLKIQILQAAWEDARILTRKEFFTAPSEGDTLVAITDTFRKVHLMPQTKREKRRAAAKPVASLAELQCYCEIVRVIKGGSCKTASQVWQATNYSRPYCLDILDTLHGPERWNRVLINTSTLKITDDGERAYEYACRILAAHAADPFADRRETLRIGTTNRVMTAFLGPKIREFLWRHRIRQKEATKAGNLLADVDLELRESSLDAILSLLRREEIDIAIGGVPLDGMPPDLDHSPIDGRLETVLIASKNGCGDFTKNRLSEGRRVKWSELATADLCVIRSDLHGVLAHLPLPAAGYTRIVVENYASVVSVVKSGAGVGLVLDMGLLDSDTLKFELEESKDRPKARKLAIWTRRGGKLTPTANAFIEAVTAMEKK